MNIPTVEEIEALVATLEKEQATRRAKLVRLITAYARIIHLREPKKFRRQATCLSDEPSCDGSYPPNLKYSDRTGPLTIRCVDREIEDVPNSGHFYHSYRTVTTHPGVYVAPDGTMLGSDMTGTGRFAYFPAHPGDCDVQCEVSFFKMLPESIAMEDLEATEQELRVIAFPSSKAAA